jgi:branched-chain amino acid transport system substrate-binding protein
MIRKELGIQKPKVAIVGAKVMWVDPMIEAIKANVPKMGMEIVGIWRPSQTTTDVSAELTAIQRQEAHIIFNIFSAAAGITFARQVAELKIPAAMVGINVEAQKEGFMEATQGKGNGAVTINTYVPGVSYNELTQPFIEKYRKKYGDIPPYTAATYDAVKMIAEAAAKAGTLDSDTLVPIFEKTEWVGTAAPKTKFDKNHDVVFGPGFATGMTIQWQDGKMKAWWPNGWEGVSYDGMVNYQLPPWMIEKYKK